MAIADRISPQEAFTSLLSNRKLALETLLEIENKERQLVPFALNPIQEDMLTNSSWRDIYVKPGQVGATSLWVADYYLDNITVNGTVSVIISYDEFSAQRLIMKAKKFHSNLAHKIPSIPKLDHKSATELSWEINSARHPFYSVMYIFSARSYTLGRGETIHNLLLDEYAFWPPGTHESTFASAVQRVPLKPFTKIRVQSTANGEDNPFCEMYKAAKEGNTVGAGRIRSVYTPHFYPWFIHPEYVMYSDDPFCLDGDDQEPLPNLQSDELTLMRLLVEQYGQDEFTAMARLRWRRYKKVEMASLRRAGETVFIFDQEFPENDETCFLVAGDMAYSPEVIEQKLKSCYPAPIHKAFTNPKTGASASAEIWFDKEEGLSYILSIDPGKGKISESVAHVWRFEEGYETKEGTVVPPVFRHCATLAGWYDEWEMAEYCKALGYYYNGAVICPEDNLDIVSHLRDYSDLYMREDVRTGKLVRAIGWQTNTSTKPYMLTELNRHMEDIECYDARFWSQCRNIRRDATMKYGISVVGPDDHHDAGTIAICCRNVQAVKRGLVGTAGWDENWGK